MLVSADTIIRSSLRRIGTIDAIETPSAEQVAVSLDALNDILDAIKNEPFASSNNTEITVTLPAMTASLTIGPGQQIDTPRPVRIESAFARLGNLDQVIEPVEKADYDQILIKGLGASWPEMLWYDGNLPTGAVWFWPLPSAPVEIHLTILSQLQPFGDSTEKQELRPGVKQWLEFKLALDLCDLFVLPVPAALPGRLASSGRALKRAFAPPINLDIGKRKASRLGRFLAGY